MTIAELLVLAEVGMLSPQKLNDLTRENASNEAFRIVAAIYGEPCEQAWKIRQIPVQHIGERVEHTVFYDLKPAEECEGCGWPCSQHGAKP